MPRPKRLKINHATYSVEVDAVECDASEANGTFHANSRRIVVNDHLAPDREREVLLHEAVHAVIDAARLTWEDSEAEEAIVDRVTGPLLSLIRENKAFIAYLQE